MGKNPHIKERYKPKDLSFILRHIEVTMTHKISIFSDYI